MAFNMPPGFGTRPGDREYFEGIEQVDKDPNPAPAPEEWIRK
jgi:hypothetical protein